MLLNVIIVFFYIYCVQFKGIPISSSKWIFILLGGYSLIFKRAQLDFFLKTSFVRISLIIFSFLLFFSIAVPLIMGTNDFHLSYSVFLFILEDFFGCFFLFLFLDRDGELSVERFFNIYANVAFVQSVIIILMLFSNSARTFFWGIQEADFSAISERYAGIRGMGLAASVTYDLGVILSLALIFLVYNITQHSKNIKLDLIKYTIILMAVAISGRTGLIGFALSLLIILPNIIRKNNVFTLLKFSFIFATFFCCVVIAYLELIPLDIRKNIDAYVFESILNYQQTGSFRSSTGDNLKQMYFAIPWDTFFFGDGKYMENGFYYMKTDVGYMRNILFWGVFPSFLLYSLYGYWTHRSYLSGKKNFQWSFRFLSLLIFVYYLIVNGKGDFLLGCRMATKLFILVMYTSTFGKFENEYRT